MVVAMSLGALIAFGQIALALILLYICGVLVHLVRLSHTSGLDTRQKQSIPQRDLS